MLVDLLLNSGLLQFGRFASDAGWQPFRLHFDLLPSYPDVLRQIVDLSVPLAGTVDHLVCLPDSLPYGVALSQQTNIPLAYGRANDVVGAYDIGHPALLIANDLRNTDDLEQLVVRAKRVGLEIDRALVIVNEGGKWLDGVEVEALLDLPAVVEHLMQEGRLPAGHGQAVLNWLNLHRPD